MVKGPPPAPSFARRGFDGAFKIPTEKLPATNY